MQAVLGIDAAWTKDQPSGIALIAQEHGRWWCIRAAPSCSAFCENAEPPSADMALDHQCLLATCRELLGGHRPTTIAIDMPLATTSISGRRAADNAVSKAFGKANCATHSPTKDRPGAVGRSLHKGFAEAGYELRTFCPAMLSSVIEVYPHVALLGLTGESERLRYKVEKTSKYWPNESKAERQELLASQWAAIVRLLARAIEGIPAQSLEVVRGLTFRAMKSKEDTLDALICAWVGTKYLANEAIPLGDHSSAIWVPDVSIRFAAGATPS